MNLSKSILSLLVSACILSACGNNDANKPTDTLSSGKMAISVDETYRPIVEEQTKVFDSSYPDAHIAWLIEPGIDGLIAHDPAVNERILWPKSEWQKLWREVLGRLA